MDVNDAEVKARTHSHYKPHIDDVERCGEALQQHQ